jgi:hypothetical protein
MLAVVVLLPLLGVILLVVAIVLVLAVGAVLAAPLLAKLPWFRDKFTVEHRGNWKTVRFGGSVFTSYQPGRPEHPAPESAGQIDAGDVIDVEGEEIPDKD